MSGMAEVLAAHRIDHQHDTVLHEQCVCGRRWMMGPLALQTHQAAMLTAAGFGPVKEAQAAALEEAAAGAGGMHDPTAADCREWADWLRARAAAVRGEQ